MSRLRPKIYIIKRFTPNAVDNDEALATYASRGWSIGSSQVIQADDDPDSQGLMLFLWPPRSTMPPLPPWFRYGAPAFALACLLLLGFAAIAWMIITTQGAS